MQGEDYRISEPVWQFSCLTTSLSCWYLYSVIKLWLDSYKEVNSLTPFLRAAWSSMESPRSMILHRSCFLCNFYDPETLTYESKFCGLTWIYLPGYQSYEDTIGYCHNRPTPFTVIGGRELWKLILIFLPLHIIELHAPYHLVLYFE